MQEISRVTWNKLLWPGEGRREGGREGQRLLRATNRAPAAFSKVTDMKGIPAQLDFGSVPSSKDGGR